MPGPDPYSRAIRQAAHDAVRALISAEPDSVEGPAALRDVVTWLDRSNGPDALRDFAEELAVDLAEALGALAGVERRPPIAVLDAWFSDDPGLGDSGPDDPGRGDSGRGTGAQVLTPDPEWASVREAVPPGPAAWVTGRRRSSRRPRSRWW